MKIIINEEEAGKKKRQAEKEERKRKLEIFIKLVSLTCQTLNNTNMVSHLFKVTDTETCMVPTHIVACVCVCVYTRHVF